WELVEFRHPSLNPKNQIALPKGPKLKIGRTGPLLSMASSFSSSHFIKTVCLNDWWLIKAECYSEGDRIAVAGIASAGRQGPKRMFSSAPIIKRYDLFTLETADGVCVMLSGYINKLRTIENGFSSEPQDQQCRGNILDLHTRPLHGSHTKSLCKNKERFLAEYELEEPLIY
ncbi:hypothetical protein Ancab_014721, partial [Ancistrocladus abbreviatus]